MFKIIEIEKEYFVTSLSGGQYTISEIEVNNVDQDGLMTKSGGLLLTKSGTVLKTKQ